MYNRGDVYYIFKHEYDRQSSEIRSGRPAIIISNDSINQSSNVLEVVYLTTQEKWESDFHIPIKSTLKLSTALCEQISSVDVSRIGSYLCSLSDEEIEELDEALAASIGLSFYTPNQEVTDEDYIRLTTERDIYKQMVEKLLGKEV